LTEKGAGGICASVGGEDKNKSAKNGKGGAFRQRGGDQTRKPFGKKKKKKEQTGATILKGKRAERERGYLALEQNGWGKKFRMEEKLKRIRKAGQKRKDPSPAQNGRGTERNLEKGNTGVRGSGEKKEKKKRKKLLVGTCRLSSPSVKN